MIRLKTNISKIQFDFMLERSNIKTIYLLKQLMKKYREKKKICIWALSWFALLVCIDVSISYQYNTYRAIPTCTECTNTWYIGKCRYTARIDLLSDLYILLISNNMLRYDEHWLLLTYRKPVIGFLEIYYGEF